VTKSYTVHYKDWVHGSDDDYKSYDDDLDEKRVINILIRAGESELRSDTETIKRLEEELLMLCVSTPRDMPVDQDVWSDSKHKVDWLEYISYRVHELFEELKEAYVHYQRWNNIIEEAKRADAYNNYEDFIIMIDEDE